MEQAKNKKKKRQRFQGTMELGGGWNEKVEGWSSRLCVHSTTNDRPASERLHSMLQPINSGLSGSPEVASTEQETALPTQPWLFFYAPSYPGFVSRCTAKNILIVVFNIVTA